VERHKPTAEVPEPTAVSGRSAVAGRVVIQDAAGDDRSTARRIEITGSVRPRPATCRGRFHGQPLAVLLRRADQRGLVKRHGSIIGIRHQTINLVAVPNT